MKCGIFKCFAAISDMQLYVSPKTSKASGFIFLNIGDDLLITLPIVWFESAEAESRKYFGFLISRSSKKISLSSKS